MFFLSKKPIDYYNLEYFWIKVLYEEDTSKF